MQLVPIELHSGESPFSSFGSMRDQHLKLLEDENPNTDRVDAFLRRGVALGRFLDDAGSRAEAQGMLDYWISNLSIQQRGTSIKESRVLPAAILERFDPSQLSASIDKASAFFATLNSSEKSAARKLLTRLAPLSPQNFQFTCATVETTDLTGGDPTRLTLLEKLAATGILVRLPGTDGGPGQWRLAHESVTHRWPEFAEWSGERRRFRQAAILWDESHRSTDRLDTRTETLQEALGHRDLNPLECDFLEASSAAAERIRKDRQFVRMSAFTAAGAVLVLALLLVSSIFRTRSLVEAAIRNEATDKEQLVQEVIELIEIKDKKIRKLTDTLKAEPTSIEIGEAIDFIEFPLPQEKMLSENILLRAQSISDE